MRRYMCMGIFLGAIWVILAGCATGGDESKPDDAISLYLSAYMDGRYEEAYQFLSAEDRQSKSLEAYVTERKDLGTFLARNLNRLIRYDVREVTLIDGNHARAKVEISIPDFRAIIGEISGALEAADYPESALENVSFVRRNVGAFEQKYQTEGIPKRTLRETFELVKEGEQWKVRAGWELKEPPEELKAMTWVRETLLFAAGITLFLYGTMRLSEEVQTYMRSLKVRRIFRFAVHNPFFGLLTGICSTVLLQSSTATSVLVVGMVSAGLMSFYRSLGIILGADIGTTLTVQLIVWKVTAVSPLIVFSGGMLWFFGQERWKKIGEGILYFGFIFFGLELVTMATEPLGQSEAVRDMIKKADHPILGLLIGLATASVVHSSAVPIGILVILAQYGLISLEHALPVVFGANVGTAVTALLASLVANINGKRVALAHFLFKLIGALICTALLSIFQVVVLKLSAEAAQQIALGHLLFNVFVVALFIFILKPSSYLIEYLLPGKARTLPIWPEYLDDRCLSNPEEALNRVRQELKRQMVLVESNCSTSMELISRFDTGKARDAAYVEFVIDNLRREVGLFLRKLSSGSLSEEQTRRLFAYSGMVDDIERIADHAVDVIKLARSKQSMAVCFTSWAEAELEEIMGYVRANLAEVVALMDDIDPGRVESIFLRENCVDRLVRDARDRHIERFNKGVCQAEAGPVFVEILLRIERMSDHCENIAEYARDLAAGK